MSDPVPQAVLPVPDLAAAARFYGDGLGFALREAGPGLLRARAPGGTALLLAAPGADLAPFSDVRRPAPGAWIYVQHADLPTLAAVLAGRGVAAAAPEVPYPGFRRLQVPAPGGFVLVFWETLPLTDAEILAIYESGPERLRRALAGVDAAGLQRRWAPGKRTVREVVHHLVEADLGVLHTLHLALAAPGSQIHFDHWDDDAVPQTLRHAVRPVEPAVALFGAARAWVLATVQCLPDGLERSVVWPSGWRSDVRSLLRHAGGHALHHIGQIEQALGGGAP